MVAIKGKRAAAAVAPKLHQLLFPVDLATSKKMNTKFENLFLSTSSDEEDNHSSRNSDAEAEAKHHPSCPLGFLEELFKEADPFTNSVVKSPLKIATKKDAAIAVAPAEYRRIHKGMETKVDEEAMHLKLNMPRVGKEDVKVSVAGNTITAVGEDKAKDGGKKKPYNCTFVLPTHSFKLEETTAEMTNGVLSLVIPKIKEVTILVN